MFSKMLWIPFVQLSGILELKISAQSDIVYPGIIAPGSPKMDSIESWTKTVVVFSGYRWIGWSYYRLCKNFWWLIISREQFRPNFAPPSPNFFAQFYKNSVIFLGPGRFGIWCSKEYSFCRNFSLWQYFWFVNWAPKWTKTVKFGCVAFEPKCKISIDISNTVFVLLETKSQSL